MSVAKKKDKSREYLESALDHAKKLLPGWMFAVIHQAALPSSGGKATRNRRMSAAEKAWAERVPVQKMVTSELVAAKKIVGEALELYTRKGMDDEVIRGRMVEVHNELHARGKEPVPMIAPVYKGFIGGEPEGGMHAHGLDRRNEKTLIDGGHVHLFVLPGSGEFLVTHEGGSHVHQIDSSSNDETLTGGEHSHHVTLPGGGVAETMLGGTHAHELMVETSGFGGLHEHILKLADGTEVKSLTPAEYVERFVDKSSMFTAPIHSAREVVRALIEARDLRDMLAPEVEAPSLEETVDTMLGLMAKGEPVPSMPTTAWEVVKAAESGAECTLVDFHSVGLMKNPQGLNLEPGDIVDVSAEGEICGHSREGSAQTLEEAKEIAEFVGHIQAATKSVPFRGPQDAKLVFVSASPSPLELARMESITGPDGALFQERYLAPLGLSKNDVATGFVIPVQCDASEAEIERWKGSLEKSIQVYDQAKVVALGRVAKQALGSRMDFSLPHPAAVRRHGDRGEIDRKIRKISKSLDLPTMNTDSIRSSTGNPSDGNPGTTLADSISELNKGRALRVAVTKSTAEKQIVYGVILDPYQVDLHNDWIPPAEIEATAHDFLAKSRVVGLRHNGKAQAEVVESWVEVYPSEKDRESALSNMPHRVWRRQFGSDVLHSGAWVAGVKLSDELWNLHKKGDLDAFSIGGFSFKTQISTEAMPEVEFVDLQPTS